MKILRKLQWMAVVASVCLWVLSVFYIGNETETAIKSAFSEKSANDETPRLLTFSLRGYQRSLMGAHFTLEVRSSHQWLNQALSEVDATISGSVKHGPLLIDADRLSFNTVEIDYQLDLSEDYMASSGWLSSESSAASLLHGSLHIDYWQRHALSLQLEPLELDITGSRVSLDGGQLAVMRKAGEVLTDMLEMRLGALTVNNDQLELTSTDNFLQFSLESVDNNGLAIAGIQLHSEQLEAFLADQMQEVQADFSGKLEFPEADQLSLFMNASFKNSDSEQTLMPSRMAFELKRVGVKNIGEIVRLYTGQQSLEEQIDWTVEAFGYSPDGQDRLHALLDSFDQHGMALEEAVTSGLMVPGQSQLAFTLEHAEEEHVSRVNLDLAWLGASKAPLRFEDSVAGFIRANIHNDRLLAFAEPWLSRWHSEPSEPHSEALVYSVNAEFSATQLARQ